MQKNLFSSDDITGNLIIANVMKSSWHAVKGVKLTFFLAFLMAIAITVVFSLLNGVTHNAWWSQAINSLINFLIESGLYYLGIRRAMDLPVTATHIFKTFNIRIASKLFAAGILLSIIAVVIILLFSLLGLHLIPVANEFYHKAITAVGITIGFIITFFFMIRLSLTIPIILAQKEAAPLYAIATSFQATKGFFWKLTALTCITLCTFIVGILTLGVGFIWLVPFSLILWGNIYKTLVGNYFNNL